MNEPESGHVRGDAPDSAAMAEQPNPHGRWTSWAAVAAILAGAAATGAALPLGATPWLVPGLALLLAGAVAAVALRVDRDTVADDSPHRDRGEPAVPPAAPDEAPGAAGSAEPGGADGQPRRTGPAPD